MEGWALVALCYHSGSRPLTFIFKESFCWEWKIGLAVIFFQRSDGVSSVYSDTTASVQNSTVHVVLLLL